MAAATRNGAENTPTEGVFECVFPKFRASLKDVMPCNLRSKNVQFVSSYIDGEFDADSMAVFLRCYGYLMHHRDEKLQLLYRFVDAKDDAANAIVAALAHCTDKVSFRECMKVQLAVVREIFQQSLSDGDEGQIPGIPKISDDGGDDAMDVDPPDQQVDDNAALDCSHSSEEQSPQDDYGNLLRLSLSQLSGIVKFIERNSDYFASMMTLNERADAFVASAGDVAGSAMNSCWSELANADRPADASTVLSLVFRDMLISTGRQTHVMVLFVIRIATILIFLIVNFVRNPSVAMRGPDDGSGKSLYDGNEHLAARGGAFAENAREAAAFAPIVTIDNFVATFIVDIVRRCFVTYLNWPSRLLARDGYAWDLTAARKLVKRAMTCSPRAPFKHLPWLRVLGDGSKRRLFVKEDFLLSFFEEMSKNHHAKNRGSTAAAPKDEGSFSCLDPSFATSSPEDSAPRNVAANVVVKLDAAMKERNTDFTEALDICLNAVTRSMRGIETETDETIARKLAKDCIFAFVRCLDERGGAPPIDTDAMGENEILPRIDLSPMHNADKSYLALQLAVSARLWNRVRAPQQQIVRFINCMIDLWNKRIGICDMNHLTLTFTELLRIFPTFVSDAATTIDTPPDTNDDYEPAAKIIRVRED